MQSISEDRQLVGTAEIKFQCASCDAANVVDALRFKTVNKWLGLITIWVTQETAVKCPECSATFRTSASLDELAQLSADQIKTRFRLRIGLVEKFLVVAGWLLVITGPVSLTMFIAAWFMVPPATRGWRRAIAIGMLISGLITVWVIGAIVLSYYFGAAG